MSKVYTQGQRRLRFAAVCLLSTMLLVAAVWGSFDHWVKSAALPALDVETSAEVRDRNGHLLRAFTVDDGRWRLATSLEDVDPRYIDLLLTYEDRRFHTHPGVDFWAIIRAAGQAVLHGEVVSGASTLTMQVVRLLREEATETLSDKIEQMRLALALERRLSKSQILELYLHRAPFGGNLEGVRAASISYFGKEPRQLSASQAALLVALPQSPELRRPDRHFDRAKSARDRVLARGYRFGVINEDVLAAGLRERLPNERRAFPAHAAHLASAVKEPNQAVSVTIDKSLQSDLEMLVRETVAGKGSTLSAAILVADHKTGEILAHVGSPDFVDHHRLGFVDMVGAVRSPGSALKPLIYGLAFDQGLAHPESLVEDRLTNFRGYIPENFDGGFLGTVSARKALQLSLNVPAVSALDAVGPARFLQALKAAGTDPQLPGGKAPGLAVALGGMGVTLHDLVTVFAAIARGGEVVQLRSDADKPVTREKPKNVLGKRAAWYVSDILKDAPAPDRQRQGKIAFKTGTSYGYRDAWAIGFDGRHVIGAWMGRVDATPVSGLSGISHAAPLLFDAFSRLKTEPDPLPPAPKGALNISHGDLPEPLKWLRHPSQGAKRFDDHPEIAFPPNGARVEVSSNTGPTLLGLKVRNGTPPFVWLVNGKAVATGDYTRDALWNEGGVGFHRISVIDADGRAASSLVRLVANKPTARLTLRPAEAAR